MKPCTKHYWELQYSRFPSSFYALLVVLALSGCLRRLEISLECKADSGCQLSRLLKLFEANPQDSIRVAFFIREGESLQTLAEREVNAPTTAVLPSFERPYFTRWLAGDTRVVEVALGFFDRCGRPLAAGTNSQELQSPIPRITVPLQIFPTLPGAADCDALVEPMPVMAPYLAAVRLPDADSASPTFPLVVPRDTKSPLLSVELLGWGLHPDGYLQIGGVRCEPPRCQQEQIGYHRLNVKLDPTQFGFGPLALEYRVRGIQGQGEVALASASRCDLVTISAPKVEFLDGGTLTWHLTDASKQYLDPVAMVLADLDGDQRDDAILATQKNQAISIMRSRVGGPFVAQDFEVVPLGAKPWAMSVLRSKKSGQANLVVALGNELRLLRNLSQPTSTPPHFRLEQALVLALPDGNGQKGLLRAADIDGDGEEDAVMLLPDLGAVLTVTNLNRAGVSPLAKMIQPDPAARPLTSLAFGDLDRDGLPEIVVAMEQLGRLRILQNRAGELSVGPEFKNLGRPSALVVADVNGDQRADILVTDYTGTSLRLLMQGESPNSSLQFKEQLIADTGEKPVALAIADFNYDGAPDLAVVSEVGDGIVFIFENTRDFPLFRRAAEKHARAGVRHLLEVGYFDGPGTQLCPGPKALPDLLILNRDSAAPTLGAFINVSH